MTISTDFYVDADNDGGYVINGDSVEIGLSNRNMNNDSFDMILKKHLMTLMTEIYCSLSKINGIDVECKTSIEYKGDMYCIFEYMAFLTINHILN